MPHLPFLIAPPFVHPSPPFACMHISHLFGDVVQSLLHRCLGISQVLFDQNWSNQFVHHSIVFKQIQLLQVDEEEGVVGGAID